MPATFLLFCRLTGFLWSNYKTPVLCSRPLCSGPLCSGPLCSRPLWSGPLCYRPLWSWTPVPRTPVLRTHVPPPRAAADARHIAQFQMTLAGSSLQSLVPKTNALSIRPQGHLSVFWAMTTLMTMMTIMQIASRQFRKKADAIVRPRSSWPRRGRATSHAALGGPISMSACFVADRW